MFRHYRVACAFALCGLLGSALAAQAPNDPAAWWKLDEVTGSVAADSSPNGNTGLLTGFGIAPWVAGQFGNAMQFNGTNQYMFAPVGSGLPIYNSRRYSVTMWINGPAQGDRRVYSEGDSVNLNPLFTLGSSGNSTTPSGLVRVFIRADNGGTRLSGESVASVFDNTWHHIAWVDNNGIGRLYIDGQLDSTFNYDPPTLTLSRVAAAAVLRAAAGNFFQGTLDDIRVYPFCLTSGDVDLVRLTTNPLPNAFQQNQATASLDIDKEVGSPASHATANVPQSALFTLTLSSTRAGFPWELAGVAISPTPGFLILSQNILNLDITHPSTFFHNGGFQSGWGSVVVIPGLPPTSSTITLNQVIAAPPFPLSVGLQFAIADPASPDGFHLSQPTQLVVN
jgi:hypothetical protein